MKAVTIALGTERITVAEVLRLMLDLADGSGIRIRVDTDRKIISRTVGGLPQRNDLENHFVEFCRTNGIKPTNPDAPWHFDYEGLESQRWTHQISVDEFKLFARPYGITILCENVTPSTPVNSAVAETGASPESELEWDEDESLPTGKREPLKAILATPAIDGAAGTASKPGVTKHNVLVIDWPMPMSTHSKVPSLKNILDEIPKWVEPAVTKCGRRGKGRENSHLWNPAILAVCLATLTNHKRWTVGQGALTSHIRSHFPDYLAEWEKALTML